jgi:type I restriction enzyme S subunit
MDSYNRENRLTIARFAMSEKCTRFIRGKFFLNDSGLTLSPKNTIQLNQDFLDYQCLAMNDVFYSLAKGSAQKNLDVPAFRKLKLNVPKDKGVQKKIVEKLDRIFAEIDKATAAVEANLKNAETLFQSFLNKILKDDDNFIQVKLLEVCENITDGSHFSPKTLDYGYPYITVRDLDEEGINFNSCRFISKVDFQKFSKNGCSPKLNDLLFSKDGTVGKVALVNKETEFVVLSSLAILTPNLKIINPFFLYYVLKSPNFLNQAIKKKTGVAIRRIILKNLKEIKIPLPPLSVQQKLIDKIKIINAEVSKLIQAHYKKSNQLKLLKNSILKKAFNGELVKAA